MGTRAGFAWDDWEVDFTLDQDGEGEWNIYWPNKPGSRRPATETEMDLWVARCGAIQQMIQMEQDLALARENLQKCAVAYRKIKHKHDLMAGV